MAGIDQPAGGRMKALPAFLVFFAIGCVAAWLSLASLLPLVAAIRGGAPLLSFAPRSAIGLPIAVSFFALARMTLYPMPGKPVQAKSGKAKAGTGGHGGLWLGVAGAGIVLALFAGPIATIALGGLAGAQGYQRCPPLEWERPSHLRWAKSGPDGGLALCPTAATAGKGG